VTQQEVLHEVTACTVVRDDDDPVAQWAGAFLEQSLPRAAYDLVVVDATPSGAVSAALEEIARDLRVEVVRIPAGTSHGAACNIAWQRATAPRVGFLSVTAIASDNWVERVALALQRGRRVVTGRWTPATASLTSAGPGSYRLWATPREAVPASTEQLAFNRKDLADVGGFNELIVEPDLCDTDVVARLVEAGVDFSFAQRVMATEDVGSTDMSSMLAARRRAVPVRRLLRERPQTRGRMLIAGLWQVREAEAALAAVGLLLAVKDRRYAALAAPWVHERTCRTPRAGGSRRRWIVLPGVLAFDVLDAVLAVAQRFDPNDR
jgi:hypothetical protein